MVVDELVDRYRIVVIDYCGWGDFEVFVDYYGIVDFVVDVEGVIEVLGLCCYVLIGYLMGGKVV